MTILQPTEGHGWIEHDRGIFYRRPADQQGTIRRVLATRLPERLLAHLRRWKGSDQKFAVEFNGAPIKDVDKALRNIARAAALPDVTPHVLRHTSATWLMHARTDRDEAADYLGMTREMLERVYGHHHPDHMLGPRQTFDRRRA